MNKEPFYKLDEVTINRIMELYKKCIEIDLGNINFNYFKTNGAETKFYLTEYKTYWELVVIDEMKYKGSCNRDIYKIIESVLQYSYSESD